MLLPISFTNVCFLYVLNHIRICVILDNICVVAIKKVYEAQIWFDAQFTIVIYILLFSTTFKLIKLGRWKIKLYILEWISLRNNCFFSVVAVKGFKRWYEDKHNGMGALWLLSLSRWVVIMHPSHCHSGTFSKLVNVRCINSHWFTWL